MDLQDYNYFFLRFWSIGHDGARAQRFEQGFEKDRTKEERCFCWIFAEKFENIMDSNKREYLFSRTGSNRLLHEDETSGKDRKEIATPSVEFFC